MRIRRPRRSIHVQFAILLLLASATLQSLHGQLTPEQVTQLQSVT
jgi:hypothetical protein